MWSTQTAWFDITVVMSIFAVGNILFGHFEDTGRSHAGC